MLLNGKLEGKFIYADLISKKFFKNNCIKTCISRLLYLNCIILLNNIKQYNYEKYENVALPYLDSFDFVSTDFDFYVPVTYVFY